MRLWNNSNQKIGKPDKFKCLGKRKPMLLLNIREFADDTILKLLNYQHFYRNHIEIPIKRDITFINLN